MPGIDDIGRSRRMRRWSRVVLAGAAGLAAAMVIGAAPSAEPGAETTLRRLSQDQYRQSIADIFGDDIKLTGRLEPDSRRDGLIAIGVASAPIGAAGFEQYDAAARTIAAQVVDPAHRATLVGCAPADPKQADAACAGGFVTRVGRLLYRRALTPAEAERLTALAGTAAKAKGDFYAGLSLTLATMLESPQFLFRMERAVPAGDGYRLDDYSVASRLSFLVWNTTPDDALLAAAERGELRTPEGVRAQLDRMLASPRFEQGVRAFFTDMLALDELDGLQKDPAIYPRFSNRLAADAREQTLRTIVDTLVRRNEDYRTLFTTRRTFLSRSLGLLYSEPVTSPTGWEAHEFAEGDPRAGLLGQPAFLMAHSHPGRSSPTLRGKAVRELILCQKVPAPPANVNFALVQNTSDPRYATARQRIAAHNTEPMCAACHKLMDPLGLPLESFDGASGMRSQENGATLDLSGELSGAKFTGSAGLGQTLAKNPALSSCLVNRLYAYSTGRAPQGPQSEWLEGLRARYGDTGLRVRDLVRDIAASDQFTRIDAPQRVAANTPRDTDHGL